MIGEKINLANYRDRLNRALCMHACMHARTYAYIRVQAQLQCTFKTISYRVTKMSDYCSSVFGCDDSVASDTHWLCLTPIPMESRSNLPTSREFVQLHLTATSWKINQLRMSGGLSISTTIAACHWNTICMWLRSTCVRTNRDRYVSQ